MPEDLSSRVDAGPLVPAPRAARDAWSRGTAPLTAQARLAGVVTLTHDWATDRLDGTAELFRLWSLPVVEPVPVAVLLDLVHAEDVSVLREVLGGRSGTEPARVRVRMTPGGVVGTRHVELTGELVRGEDGAAVGRLLVLQDVGGAVADGAQDGGRSAATRLTELLSLARVAVATVSESGVVLDANDVLATMLGRTPGETTGLHVDDVLHPDDRAPRPADAPVGSSNPTPTTRTVSQRRLVHADGSVVHVEVHQSLVLERGRRVWMVVLHDVTDHRRRLEEQRLLDFRDGLTGLPNRVAVMDLLSELVTGLRDPGTLAVALCDVDRFQRVNDSLGHQAGDELLLELGAVLERGLARCCTAGRLSGDEFVVVCCELGTHGGADALGMDVATLLRRSVTVGGQDVRVSAAVGVAVAAADSSPTDLLRYADAAMYQAKRLGPGRTAVAGELLRTTATHQVQLEAELREALSGPAGAGLQMHYQPVVTGDGRIVSAEALLRWQHPRLGMLLPGQLLPVAEQGALLGELDEWVLATAATEAATWPGDVSVAVNLSGIAPGDPDFVAVVEAAVAPTGLPWNRLTLELVETRLVDLSERARTAMEVLIERGVRFAVDDFGTGYSSLARLKELPVQVLKVDRTFVSGVGRDPSDFAVVRAVVEMARAMGRTCVAEGVETLAQFQVLRGMGVDGYQGWLFSRAVDSAELRELLEVGSLDETGARRRG